MTTKIAIVCAMCYENLLADYICSLSYQAIHFQMVREYVHLPHLLGMLKHWVLSQTGG